RLNHHVEERFTGHVWIRNDHFIGAGFANGFRQVRETADYRNILECGRPVNSRGEIVDDANDSITEFRSSAHLANAQRRFRSATNNQSWNKINAPTPDNNLACS